jgi:hypothetical protein
MVVAVRRTLPRQRGQALLAGLGLVLVGAAMLVTLFGTGQVLGARQRLADAADAAAWSTGLWRARVLNFHAYSNRAILVNEVAIAQAATLLAWAKHFETLAANAALLGPLLPPAEPVLTGVAEAARLAREAAQLAAEIEIPARGAAGVGYKSILQTSQEILQLSAHGFGASMVAAEVARANDPSFFAWTIPESGAHRWSRFTRRADGVDERRPFAELVVASLDPFTSGPRSADIRTPVPSPCLNLMRLRKRGATTLSESLDRWEAQDTLSFHLRTLRGLGCREREALPLGWGAVEVGAAREGLIETRGEVGINPAARELAAASMARFGSWGGIEGVRELDLDALDDRRFPVTRVAVVARAPASAAATGAQRGLAAGRLAMPERFAGERLWALAAAQVYFRRPPDAPARIEYASLYNPYWQVRLAEPTPAERAAAVAYAR